MTDSGRLWCAALVFFVPSILPAQSRMTQAPNRAYAAITQPIAKILSGDRAYATTNYVQQFYRNPASRGFDASIDTVVQLLAAAGYVPEAGAGPNDRLTYRIESRPSRGLVWSPLGASITMQGRKAPLEQWSTNHNMLPSGSWSTPAGGVDAEIVNVGGGGDAELDQANVRGKIIYSESPGGGGRGRGRGGASGGLVSRAAARGAVGALLGQQLPAYNQQQKNRTAINFQTNGLSYDTTARIFVINVSLAARDTLNAALASGPVRAHVETETVFENRPERTLVAEIRGSVAPQERFVYSAHVQEPGANDNATGVALLAEMARTAAVMLKAKEIDPARTITMLWGVEIQQTQRYIAEDSVRRKGIKWGMSLDMVGENTALTGGTFLIEKMPDPSKIWVRGEDQHTEWGEGQQMTARDIWPYWYNDFVKQRCVDESAATGGTWVVKANPYEGGSDHTPFITARIPGVLMWHFTDQHYHDDLDRINMVSASELQHVGRCALATSLILTSGTRAYAVAALDELAGIAERRLDAEGTLSRAALAASPADSTTQRTILEAWRDYYVAALAKVPEMTLPHDELTSEVAAAQARVARKGGAVIGALKR
ncbi:MAG TPA: M28 family peptidase [Gemmatimonadales bacterium]